MTEYRKMNRFLPPGGDDSIQSDFECWHPDPTFAAKEPAGMSNDPDKKTMVPMIEADGPTYDDLPDKLKKLVEHCWQSAKASPGAQRGGLQIGGARQQAFDALGKPAQQAMAAAGQHVRVSPSAPPIKMAHLAGIAQDWKLHKKLDRVNAFTFRGDSRKPADVKGHGGFAPPNSRTDDAYLEKTVFPEFTSYLTRRFPNEIKPGDIIWPSFKAAYTKVAVDTAGRKLLAQFITWKSIMESESLHLGRMVANQVLKAYISTTRKITVAKGFANTNGWVYLLLVRGGLVVPLEGRHEWQPIFGEQEISYLGSIPWTECFGFRQMGPKEKKFIGPIYIRKGFDQSHRKAFEQAYDLFSGKPQ